MPDSSLTSDNLGRDAIIGYVLLATGLLLIFAATYMVYGVLTGKAKPPQVYNVEAPSFQLPTDTGPKLELPEGATLAAGLRLTKDSNQSPPGIKLIPDEVFNGSLNIGLYYLAMMFLASSGAKIAGLGIKMIKDIKVS